MRDDSMLLLNAAGPSALELARRGADSLTEVPLVAAVDM